MVWYFVSGMHKLMTTFIVGMLVLIFLEPRSWQSKCYHKVLSWSFSLQSHRYVTVLGCFQSFTLTATQHTETVLGWSSQKYSDGLHDPAIIFGSWQRFFQVLCMKLSVYSTLNFTNQLWLAVSSWSLPCSFLNIIMITGLLTKHMSTQRVIPIPQTWWN
jgi:hypothetical protein